jgi:molybdopterin-dependent oxidoreductase alpha subunit
MSGIPSAGGGFHAIAYTFRQARQAGGVLKMYRALRAKNACKTCALGMGGQKGGMTNELGHFPEFCKKSVQALAADMQPALPVDRFTSATLEQLRDLSPRQLEAMGRITVPLVHEVGAAGFRAATWDEALTRLAGKLQATARDEAFFYFSGRSSNEAGFLLQLFARVWGTNHVNNCSFYCHQASGVGLTSVFGQGVGTVPLDGLDHTDLVLLIGANPASNHPRFMRTLMELKRRGGKVIVVNPLREIGLERFRVPSDPRSLLFGTTIADHCIQPHCGGDLAFLLAVMCAVRERGALDTSFLAEHTTGWAELSAYLDTLDPDELATRSGVSRAEIDVVAAAYAASKATVFAWAMGITHHRHGTATVRAIADLALLRGMAGRPGAGLLPLRGHSNIQGLGTVGVTPLLKDAIAKRVEAHLGLTLPTTPGLDTMGCMQRAHAGQMRTAWCLGGNLWGSSPDATWTREAMARIDQVVYFNTTLNTGHVHGLGRETWILPVRARDEEAEPTTQESMFSYVRLSDGGPARFAGPRGEVAIIADLAARMLGTTGPVDWARLHAHQAVRELIAAVVPGLAGLQTIAASKAEFHIAGRAYPEPKFATPDGKARLQPVTLPPATELAPGQLRLMTIRSEGQFNTVVYEDHDRYRGTTTRDVILLAAEDIAARGWRVGQRVTVRSGIAAMPGIRVVEGRIRAGNAAMYYPEANVLVPRETDPDSGTPSFKDVAISLTAE